MSHIIIVGAGISGLFGAVSLLKQHHTVTILEARERPGGRIHTISDKFSCPVEAGAEFIHGQQPITLSLVRDAMLKATPMEGEHYTIDTGEINKGDSVDDHWKKFYENVNGLDTDMSLYDFLEKYFGEDKYKDFKIKITRFAEGFDIADPERVSVMALSKEWEHNDEEHQYHLEGGYSKLVTFLVNKILESGGTITYNVPVVKVTWSQGHVHVMTDGGGVFEGNRIMLTVPAGVMNAGVINFDPAINEATNAYQKIGFGSVIKFLFEFDMPFWEKARNHSFPNASFFFSSATVPTWWTQLPDTTPLLTGWLGGPIAAKAPRDQNVLYDMAVESLASILDTPVAKIISHIRHWEIFNWVDDPFARGGYTYPALDAHEAIAFLSGGINDTIFFAGEALYEGDALGTVEGALTNGLAIAEKVGKLS